MEILLASESPYRRELLSRTGLLFESKSPLVDEEKLKKRDLPSVELCGYLAKQKALSLKEKFPHHLIIGADQLLDFKNEILGKPGNEKNNINQLKRLNGQKHNLITSFFMTSPKGERKATNITQLHMRNLTEEEIKTYVAQDQAFDCAGGYKLEQAGICLFSEIKTDDQTAIVGLPMIELTRCIKGLCGELPFMMGT